jgi:hypothetical protein
MKAFQRNVKPSLETHVDRSDWKIVMIPGHCPHFDPSLGDANLLSEQPAVNIVAHLVTVRAAYQCLGRLEHHISPRLLILALLPAPDPRRPHPHYP